MFLPGTTTQTVTVAVTGDRDVEPDETFVVRLSGLSGVLASQGTVTIAKARGTGTIASDDAARTYFLAEGATGSFFIRRSDRESERHDRADHADVPEAGWSTGRGAAFDRGLVASHGARRSDSPGSSRRRHR